MEEDIKKESVFLPTSAPNSNRYFNRNLEDTQSDSVAPRRALRVPIEQGVLVKCKRESFESDCAVGSLKATNETQILSEIFTENSVQLTDSIISNKDINLLSVNTEDTQEDKLFPSSGSCFSDFQPHQDMADPFYEEFMDFSNLFPDLIPGVVEDAGQFLPEIPPELMMLKDEPPPIKEILEDLDSIFAETEVAIDGGDQEEEILEVVDEAPTAVMQEMNENHSVLSPGSVVSLESCDTGNCTSTYAESTSSDIDAELLQILDLFEKTPKTDNENLVPDFSTIDVSQISPETSVTSLKRKSTAIEEPATKRVKGNHVAVNSSTDKATQRRLKNNVASRVCRASRKKKEEDLFKKEQELIESNAALRAQIGELMEETQALRNILVQRLSGNN